MDWVKQLNEAIDYIEDNLESEISYETISKIAGCSVYNFQRMFSYIAAKPLSEYIRNRRLTLAAFDVLNGDKKIINLALKYGYESQDAFSRAFRNFHGVLPSVVRNEVTSLKSCPKLSFQITIKGAQHMNYQIEQWPSFKVSGFVTRIKTNEAFQVIPLIWDNAWKDGMIEKLTNLFKKTDYRPSVFLGIAMGGQWGNSEEMDYILAVTNDVDVEECIHIATPHDMKEYSFPAATWVVINADGELPDAVQRVYEQFYTQWLPNSGYALADLPVIESYMMDNRQEVWISIIKNRRKFSSSYMMKTMVLSMKYSFRESLFKDGNRSFIKITFNVWETCNQKGLIPVKASIDDISFECKLTPKGNGIYYIPVTKSILSQTDLTKEHNITFEIINGLSRIINNSPYTKDNPIRRIDTVQSIIQPQDGLCGQTCVAMLTGLSVEKIIEIMNSKAWKISWSKIIETLDYFGISYSEKVIYTKGKDIILPNCCIISVRTETCNHFLLYFKEKYYDSVLGILDTIDMGKIVCYLEIIID